MRAILLAVLLLTGCTGGPGAPPSPGSADAVVASPMPLSVSSSLPPAPSTAVPAANGVYTAADEEVAEFLTTGAAEVIPRLKVLNAMDPSKLEDLFVPLGVWITKQKTTVEAYIPSDCTAVAVARFMDGLDAYDDIREKFLAWRDWGAHGHAFHPEAPRQAAALFEEALIELKARCTA